MAKSCLKAVFAQVSPHFDTKLPQVETVLFKMNGSENTRDHNQADVKAKSAFADVITLAAFSLPFFAALWVAIG